ncbi:DNRLRE domain-containing protein, partial [bacterium]|nr:DNRLRE domain-containing protein [candidate division CSSED10-310 bacterium]
AAPPFPEICLPELSHSASPPTWTPDPPTPTPTPTPTPSCSYIELVPEMDCYVDQSNPDQAFGGDLFLKVFSNSGSDDCYAYMKFNLDDLPADAALVSSTLTLNFLNIPAWGKINYSLVTSEWNEETTFNTQPTNQPNYTSVNANESSVTIDAMVPLSYWTTNPMNNHGLKFQYYYGNSPKRREILSRESMAPPVLKVWYNSQEPKPTPTPTPPSENDYLMQLYINQANFKPGDSFLLSFIGKNQLSFEREANIWIVLDAYGMYWFYPSWSSQPDYEIWTFEGYEYISESILHFTWPSDCGSAAEIRFWGGIEDPQTHKWAYDMVSFGWTS